MTRFLAILTLCFFAMAAGSASASQNLLEIWADIRLISYEKAYIVDAFEVSNIFGEITRLGDYDRNDAGQQKALEHLQLYASQISFALQCPPDRQETINRIFLKYAAPRPERMRVKLRVTLDSDDNYDVSIVDHQLQIMNESYVYSPAGDPADYVFIWCPETAEDHGVGAFIIADRTYLEKTGDLLQFEPPREIDDLLRSLNMPKAAPSTYQYSAGTGNLADDRERGADILMAAGFQPAEDFNSL
ncbi:MAG: hypothetical protein CVV42_03455 [Candidatus Riflebacteria bacterium HGW-Riflebacteria-2]|jgi:hypothetical protein|nr:MAG: hypothetical protein CVV42_03455 [Candidatus Riflebacteria bacterium HGW-Riflebacteria-2]